MSTPNMTNSPRNNGNDTSVQLEDIDDGQNPPYGVTTNDKKTSEKEGI
jgi:hypothetical protein